MAKPGEFPAGSLVLAAGTLCSARIFLESLYRDSGKAPELHGVMDNRQILMPFVNLRMLGRPWNPDTYQYHQLAMAVRMDTGETIHGLITTLKTALIILWRKPFRSTWERGSPPSGVSMARWGW